MKPYVGIIVKAVFGMIYTFYPAYKDSCAPTPPISISPLYMLNQVTLNIIFYTQMLLSINFV